MLSLALVSSFVAGCASTPEGPGTLRFAIAPPVWRVADRAPLPKDPVEREYNRTLYHTDGFVVRRATRAMEVSTPFRAEDVNSLDEVPDSSWFVNRIGRREMSIEELKRGANFDPSPIHNLPWTITGAKAGGTALGYVFEDAKGDKYLLKFDMVAEPEMETGAHILGHRIVWAAGWNVPQDYVELVDRKSIKISPKATKKDALGTKAKLTEQDFDDSMKRVFHTEDGRIRVLVSRYLPGLPIGPYAREGRRDDDPNDKIAHERRRTIRGQKSFFSWINHTDLQEDNSLDAFVRHPGPDGKPGDKGHIVHYLIDFGKAFGVMGYVNRWRTVGYTYRFDVGKAFTSFITLGLREREWDAVDSPTLLGLGLFESKHFDPGTWITNSPYWPYEDADRFDGFWGAKLAMRFSREQLEAIVSEAKFSDPRTAKYMLDTLIERQRKVGAYWFRQVTPFDAFGVKMQASGTSAQLCFDDLALRYGLEVQGASSYTLEVYASDGALLVPQRSMVAQVHTCIDVPLAGTADRYTVVRLGARRNANWLPPVTVHLARDPAGNLSVVGVRRL